MWALHEKHDDSFKANQRKTAGTVASGKPEPKKVSFNAIQDETEAATDDNGEVQIRVKDDLLHNAKSYLSTYSNFQKGGV